MSETNTTVPLSTPIKRANGADISELVLAKPNTGALRGLKLMDVLQMDVTALTVLLPRIAQPTITKTDVESLELADMMDLGVAVVGFFEPTTAPKAAPATA